MTVTWEIPLPDVKPFISSSKTYVPVIRPVIVVLTVLFGVMVGVLGPDILFHKKVAAPVDKDPDRLTDEILIV